MSNRPLNVGLVGGGKGAFIVHPHQKAIHFDGTRRVVAGALFPDPKIALEEAANWPYPIKGYGSYDEMIAANATLPEDQKLDYILIVTPNFVHFDPAMKAMKAGIAVFCEKPLCLNLKEANDLVKTVAQAQRPLRRGPHLPRPLDQPVQPLHRPQRPARRRPLGGQLLHPGLARDQARSHRPAAGLLARGPQARRRFRLRRRHRHARPHAAPLRHRPRTSTQLSAQLETFVEGRTLDDHFTIYCKLSNGGKALVRASQICIGHKNDLGIEIAGTKGTLVWRQEEPEAVTIMLAGPARPRLLARRGHARRRLPAQGRARRPDGRADHSRRATPRPSTTPSPACTAASRPTCASGRPAKPSSATAPNTPTSRTAGWASPSSRPASRAARRRAPGRRCRRRSKPNPAIRPQGRRASAVPFQLAAGRSAAGTVQQCLPREAPESHRDLLWRCAGESFG